MSANGIAVQQALNAAGPHASQTVGGNVLPQNLQTHIDNFNADVGNLFGTPGQAGPRPNVPTPEDLQFKEYTNKRFADVPAEEAAARRLANPIMRGASNFPLQEAKKLRDRSIRPFHKVSNQYINPYINQMQKALERSMLHQRERAMRELNSQYAGAGVHGGRGYQQARSELESRMADSLLRAQSELMHEGYKEASHTHARDADRMLEGAAMQARLNHAEQANRWTDIQNLSRLAEDARANEQQKLDFSHEQWLNKNQHWLELLNLRGSLLNRMPYAVSTYRTHTPGTPQRGPSMGRHDWLHTILGAAGLR